MYPNISFFDFESIEFNPLEYIKFILEEGIYIGEKNYKFFNFSQSQFRNISCWLLTDPKKILSKTGDYSNINIVAKFGAINETSVFPLTVRNAAAVVFALRLVVNAPEFSLSVFAVAQPVSINVETTIAINFFFIGHFITFSF